ncbi:MAG: hypothetical protein SCARUB_04085 [Candidatus Scalindua rubra]|uniref:Uncharacterized protein n=1 Tax=Candidatus Scalindua rubra TaxID=1872076 RepID=A0A1E3X734_9BACT|nr:MAG: hypothetical protein SCARUB_04085 [Candidatus Scalindua rubra]
MNSNILLIDKNTHKSVRESDLVVANGGHCPVCRIKIETINEHVVIVNNSRLLCWIKETGQVIKKCECKTWLRLPYKLAKFA